MPSSNDCLTVLLGELLKHAGEGQELMDNRGFARLDQIVELKPFKDLGVTIKDIKHHARSCQDIFVLTKNDIHIRWKKRQ